VSGLVTAGLGGVALWCARDALGSAYGAPFALALLVLPLFALQDYAEGVARSFNWVSLAIAPPYILRQGLLAASVAGATALAGAAATPAVAVAAMLAATGIALAGQGTILARRLRRALPPGPRVYRWRAWASASLPIAVVDLATCAFTFVDMVLLGFFASPETVAVYFAATRILQFVVFVRYAATAATSQRFAEAWAHEDRAMVAALVARTARLATLATLGVGAAVLAASPLLLASFGPGFGQNGPVLTVLIGGAVLQSAFGPAEDVLNMLGGERACAAISLAFVVLAVGLNLALIPPFGAVGAAFAMAISGVGRGCALSVAAQARLGLATHVLAPVKP
jgi:O-antigen/teichoic acid export membrane protein